MANCPFTRYAIVKNARSQREVEVYLPDNYKVIYEFESADGYLPNDDSVKLRTHTCFVVEGKDDAGWTLDSYVIPRLASGMIYADEVDLSHPVMKLIPA